MVTTVRPPSREPRDAPPPGVDGGRAGGVARRASVVVLTLVAAALLPGLPAEGHASRAVPHATLDSDGREVHIEWTAAQDDTADVLVAAGLLPPEAMEAYLTGPIEDRPGADETARLSRSPQLRDYLEEHVAVTQDGVPCPGRATPAENFIDDGARFTFACPQPVTVAHVRITLLHDRDPDYRTYSVDGTIQTEMHTSSAPEHAWDFTLAASSERDSTRIVLLVVLGVVALAMLGAWRLLRSSEPS